MQTYRRYWKCILDLLIVAVLLLVLFPFLLELSILIRIFLGSPILFRQLRPGYKARPFTLFKFRTMLDARDLNGRLLSDTERLTPLGLVLRSLSLDELPELFNVIRGDMSFVGPRPLLMEYLPCYTPEQRRRHDVKPGITGWAQVNGRNDCLFSKRIEMDIYYVDHVSLKLDLKIIILSFLRVGLRRDVRADMDQCLVEMDDCGFLDALTAVDHPASRDARGKALKEIPR